MAITLELSADVEERLKDKAAVHGLSVGKYVEKLLEEKVGKPEQPARSPEEVREAALKIIREFRDLPTLHKGSAQEAIEYDDYGLPT